MLLFLYGEQERIENRVGIPDGTAAVCAEGLRGVKAGHWETEKAARVLMRHKSEELLRLLPVENTDTCSNRLYLLCKKRCGILLGCRFFKTRRSDAHCGIQGRCRKRPPQAFVLSRQQIKCGKHSILKSVLKETQKRGREKEMKKRLVALVLAVVLMLQMQNVAMTQKVSAAPDDSELSVVISMEGLTLGQGLYAEPKEYTLSQINNLLATEGYGPYEEGDLTAGMATLAFLLDHNLEYTKTGNWEDTAYLSGVKGIDTGVLNIPAIITENGGPSNEENDGNDDEYLGEFDYSSMSGWMITVNHSMINVGCSQYVLDDNSVIRWHFTLWGYGADLGFGTGWGMDAFYEAANKDALYTLYAKLNAKGFFASHEDVKQQVLAVMEDLTAAQADVDQAQAILEEAYAGLEERTPQDVSAVLNSTMAQLALDVQEPQFGTLAGEWSVLGLARGGYYEKGNAYFEDYYKRIEETVRTKAESVNLNGALHKVKSTENSRLILALSAIGKDARSVGGWNLVLPFEDFSWITKQGINGPVFALIALDSHAYETQDTTIREQCVAYLLEKQLADGGWALSGSSADPDMTAMTLQALAPYRAKADVAAAIEKGTSALSGLQKEEGGYASWGSINSESISQVITACAALGINPDTDERFIKNGHSAVDALLTFYNESSRKFSHVAGDGGHAMATDQATYALVAYKRLVDGKNRLYDMTDVEFDDTQEEVDHLTAYMGAPKEITNTVGTSFAITVTIAGWDAQSDYRLMDCIMAVPSFLKVTKVAMSDRVSGGQVDYNLEEDTGKLRMVYFNPKTYETIQISGTQFPAELFTVTFEVKEKINIKENPNLGLAITGMSFKRNSDSADEASIAVVDTAKANASIDVVQGISFSAVCLYQGDGIDLIPENKKAVAVFVTGIKAQASLLYQDGTNTVDFLYNQAISEKSGISAYVALVDASMDMEAFTKKEFYTIDSEKVSKTLLFGDTDKNGVINAQDALAEVSAWLRKGQAPAEEKILILNVNGDSRINTFDALGIVEYFVKGYEFAIVTRAVMAVNEQIAQ